MSLWRSQRSGWVSLALGIFLIIAVTTSICSSGLRSGFKIHAPNSSFHSGGSYLEVGFVNTLLICSGIFGVLSVGLRYSYIMDQVQVMPRSIDYLNKASIPMGIISFLGLFIIASFSVALLDNESTPQYLGTYIFIGVGVIFTVLQTVLTYSSRRYSFVFIARFLLALILMSSFLTSIIFTEKSKEGKTSNPSNSSNITAFYSHLEIRLKTFCFIFKGWILIPDVQDKEDLLIACILDWISVIVYALFFLSFFHEFQTISVYIIMRPFIGPSSTDFRSSSMTVNERI